MRTARIASLVLLLLAGAAYPAQADLTAFVGNNATPSNRLVRGVGVGFSLLVVGLEFEWANTKADAAADAPSLTTGMANLLVQTPFGISGIQFYATAGAGLYREEGGGQQETSGGTNVGGGIKIAVAGPIRMRIDYRVFSLRGSPQHDTHHRIYAGLNIGF